MGEFADQLLTRLEAERTFPPPGVRRVWEEKARWVAHRESDRDYLAVSAGFDSARSRYHVDPLPDRISGAFASLVFGREPEVTPGNESDRAVLEDLVAENRLGQELQRAERVRSSEGEVWWRLHLDRRISERALLEWHSRLGVIPLFLGGRLKAVAFVSRLTPGGSEDGRVDRHFEVHDETDVTNVLFVGSNDTIGHPRPLTENPETADLVEAFAHGLPDIPAGWVPNRLGVERTSGISDYAGIEDYFWDLNESLVTASRNASLTAKKRMLVPAAALDEQGRLRDEDVIVNEVLDAALGDSGGSGNAYRVLEYSFDAQALIFWQDSLARNALTRVGLIPQFVGVAVEGDGLALSGTALRVRLIPTVNAAADKGAEWDSTLPDVLALAQLLDAHPWDGEPGQAWTRPDVEPALDRGHALPSDPNEEADRIALLRSAKVISLEEAVRELHPDWEEEQVLEEVARLEDETAASTPAVFTGALPAAENGGPPPEDVPQPDAAAGPDQGPPPGQDAPVR